MNKESHISHIDHLQEMIRKNESSLLESEETLSKIKERLQNQNSSPTWESELKIFKCNNRENL